MGYLDESGLARYDGLIKQWVTFKSGTVDGIDPLLNWQKTETAASVTCYPLPAAPIDPTVNFLFTETGPAEGEKSPTNPSTVTGVSTITVTRCETVGVDSTDYTIDLGDTYYGGSIDLASGVMTVTQFGETLKPNKVFSSGATFNTNTIGFLVDLSVQHKGASSDGIHISNKFIYANNGNDFEHFRGVGPETGWYTIRVFINKTRLNLSGAVNPNSPTEAEYAAAFSAWLADNPVFVVLDRFVPATLQLTPTQIYSLSQADPYTPRLNTVYSDQTSVQVGFPKSPLATATELTNAIVSLGGNA